MTPKQVKQFAAYSWAEMIAEDSITTQLDPDEMTPASYAEKTHLSKQQAGFKLRMRYERGELTRRRYGKGYAYRVKG